MSDKNHSEMAEERRRLLHRVFLVLCVAAGVILAGKLIEVIVLMLVMQSFPPPSADIGIIGGADGPTAIFVSRSVSGFVGWLIGGILAVVSVIGFVCTKKR